MFQYSFSNHSIDISSSCLASTESRLQQMIDYKQTGLFVDIEDAANMVDEPKIKIKTKTNENKHQLGKY